MDWADMLLRMYLRWAERRGYQADILDLMPGDEAGLKSVTVEVAGAPALWYLGGEGERGRGGGGRPPPLWNPGGRARPPPAGPPPPPPPPAPPATPPSPWWR